MSVFEKEVQVLILAVGTQMGPGDLQLCAKAAVENVGLYLLGLHFWDRASTGTSQWAAKPSFSVLPS